MNFIVENYFWIIIIVIAILMAVVGYIADKTDFGRKEFERKVKDTTPKKDKKSSKKDVVAETVDNSDSSELLVDDNTDMAVIENMYQNGVSEDSNLEELNQVEITNLNETVSEVPSSDIDQSLFEPLPSIEQVFSEPVTTEQVENNVVTDENVSSSVQEDDVWKF